MPCCIMADERPCASRMSEPCMTGMPRCKRMLTRLSCSARDTGRGDVAAKQYISKITLMCLKIGKKDQIFGVSLIELQLVFSLVLI